MELLAALPAPEGTRQSRNWARRYTKSEWEAIKPKMLQLYIQEGKTLKEVMAILEQEDGFIASEKQLKTRIAKWEYFKNLKGSTKREIARARAKRKWLEGKDSMFIVHEKLVAQRKINRYVNTNKISEEELVFSTSPIDVPSPDFRVSTPRPDFPINVGIQITRSGGNPMSRPNYSVSSVIGADSMDSDKIMISNDLAHSHLELSPCTSDNSVAISTFHNQSSTSKRDIFLDYPPRCLQNQPESPESLLTSFRGIICPMLSSADGQNNLWNSLVLPLWQDSPSLYNVISAITALQIATDSQLRIHGEKTMGQSLASLNRDIKSQTLNITTLATILLLAFWTRWNKGLHEGKVHILGAVALLPEVWSQYTKGSSETWPGDSYPLLAFMHDTCSRMDSLSRLVRSAMGTDQYITFTLPAFEELYPEDALPGLSQTDPWMGCMRRLFPLISRTADLCNKANSNSIKFSAIIEEAVALKYKIKAWSPDTDILFGTDTSAVEVSYIKHTAEAYRYATLLYLGQVVPEVFPGELQQIPGKILGHLNSVPSHSRMMVVQTFPLFVAGCEACTERERQWVKKRWAAMISRMTLKNLEKCWEITQEVWRRRDNYRQQRNDSSADHRGLRFGCEGEIMEKLDPELLVMGQLHWARVMKDWGWEVSF